MTRRVPDLASGEKPTHETYAGLIKRAQRRTWSPSGPTTAVHESRSGTSSVPISPPEAFSAIIRPPYVAPEDEGSDDPPTPLNAADRYEWKEAIREDGEWTYKEGGRYSGMEYRTGGQEREIFILAPAVEINGISGIQENTIVTLIPGRTYYDRDLEHLVTEYLFSYLPELQPFMLVEDLIPCRYIDNDAGDPEEFPTCRVKAKLIAELQPSLEEEEEQEAEDAREVWLYPTSEHFSLDRSVDEDDDWEAAAKAGELPIIALGIGRQGNGDKFDGTFGWCRWVEKIWEEYTGGGDEFNTISGYQIVNLNANLFATAEIYDNDAGAADYVITPGMSGSANLWWADQNFYEGDIQNSGYEIKVWNKTLHPIYGGMKYTIRFDQQAKQWQIFEIVHKWYAKAQEDWQHHPPEPWQCWVSCKICDAWGLVFTNTEPFDIHCNRIGHNTGLDPSIYTDDVIQWEYDCEGTPVVTSPVFHSKIGDIKMGRWLLADIESGWHECDGSTQASIDGNVDLMEFGGQGGRFPKQREGAEAIGDHGGFQWHGAVDHSADPSPEGPPINNHPDHDNHEHFVDALRSATAWCETPTVDVKVWDASGATVTAGVQALPPPLGTGGTDLANHLGPFNGAEDTDNKPPHCVVYFIERYR